MDGLTIALMINYYVRHIKYGHVAFSLLLDCWLFIIFFFLLWNFRKANYVFRWDSSMDSVKAPSSGRLEIDQTSPPPRPIFLNSMFSFRLWPQHQVLQLLFHSWTSWENFVVKCTVLVLVLTLDDMIYLSKPLTERGFTEYLMMFDYPLFETLCWLMIC